MSDLPNVLLSMVVWSPAVAALVALFMPERTQEQRGRLRLIGLAGAGFALLLVLLAVYARIGEGAAGGGLNAALVERHAWVQAFPITAGYHLDADGLSLPLLLLSTMVFVSALFAAWKNDARVRTYTVLLLLVEVGVNGVLCAHDLLLFVLFWGLPILPLFLLIAGWGGEMRRPAAGRYLAVAATSFGLLVLAVGLVVAVAVRSGHPTFDLVDISGMKLETLSPGLTAAAFWLFLVGFCLALAAVPLHRWMIDACAEASTPVATVIVGILVPLSAYGMIRVVLGVFPRMAHHFSLVIVALAVVAALWGPLAARAEDDVRRLVLYSSVGQMAMVLLAIGTQSSLALGGVVLLLLAHGFAYALLLILSGSIEERGRTRSISRLGGLAWQAPRLGWLWAFAGFAAIGAPLLAGFTAEFLVFTGAFPAHRWATVLVMGSMAVTTAVLLLTVHRIFFGAARETLARVADATTLELTCVSPLLAGIVFFGILPRSILPVITAGVTEIGNRLASGG